MLVDIASEMPSVIIDNLVVSMSDILSRSAARCREEPTGSDVEPRSECF
jgi:hypothetical protein